MAEAFGMRTKGVALSAHLQLEFGVEGVHSFVDKNTGDGFVQNHALNGVLSGLFIIHRFKRTKNGKSHYREFVPIDNALIQTQEVNDQIAEEDGRLIGSFDERGLPIKGDIEKVASARAKMANWLSLTPDEEKSISVKFEEIVRGRTKATNPLNISIADKASKIATLMDSSGPYEGKRKNPRAKMAQSVSLQDDMMKRHEQLEEDAATNRRRGNWLAGYVLDENLRLADITNAIDRLANHSDVYYLNVIINASKRIKFRVQLANQYLDSLDQLSGPLEERVLNKDLLDTYKHGIEFARHKNYLLGGFRQLASGDQAQLDDMTTSQLEDMQLRVSERLAALEEMTLPEPYNRLKGRILLVGAVALESVESRDSKVAQLASKEYKKLMIYHCLPKGDPDFDTWYKHPKKK